MENKKEFIPEATTDEEVNIEKVVAEYKEKYLQIAKIEMQNKIISASVLLLLILTIVLKIFLKVRKNRGGKK